MELLFVGNRGSLPETDTCLPPPPPVGCKEGSDMQPRNAKIVFLLVGIGIVAVMLTYRQAVLHPTDTDSGNNNTPWVSVGMLPLF